MDIKNYFSECFVNLTKNENYIISAGRSGVNFHGDGPNLPTGFLSDIDIIAMAVIDSTIFLAKSDKTVCSYDVEGTLIKQIGKFAHEITCICANDIFNDIIIGFSDSLIKRINVNTHSQKSYEGHKAPILSLSMNIDLELLASSSCDGTVKIWDFFSTRQLESLVLFPKSNVFSLTGYLVQIDWCNGEKMLAIPLPNEIHIYDSSDWQIIQKFNVEKKINVVKFSPCGRYISFGGENELCIFDIKIGKRIKSFSLKESTICSIQWLVSQKNQYRLVFADIQGHVGKTTSLLEVPIFKKVKKTQTEDEYDIDDLDGIVKESEMYEAREFDLDHETPILPDENAINKRAKMGYESVQNNNSSSDSKSFGAYFKEAQKRNPIGLVTEEEFARQNKIGGLASSKLYKSISNVKDRNNGNEEDDDEFDIGKVKAKYYQSVAADRDLILSSLKQSTSTSLNDNNNNMGQAKYGRDSKDYPKSSKTILDLDLNELPYSSTKNSYNIDSTANRNTSYGAKTDNVPLYRPRLQKPFQPGSTPSYLNDHFLMWNEIGIIQKFSNNQQDPEGSSEDTVIEVDFLDKAMHHPITLKCTYPPYNLADLSEQAVVLAYHKDDEILEDPLDAKDENSNHIKSSLKCLHFSSWDTNKEWEINMSIGENIECLTLGTDWCAIGLNTNIIRLFHISGLQLIPFALPGSIVCMRGRQNLLAVVYADTNGNNLYLHNVYKNSTVITSQKIPAPMSSQISWIGFSECFNFYVAFSTGHIMSLASKQGYMWVPIMNIKESLKNKSDTYWLVSISENSAQIRAVYCKGSSYPLTLPKPTITLLPLKLSLLCRLDDDEHTQLENDFWLPWYLDQNCDSTLSRQSQERHKSLMNKQSTTIIKLFALYCQTNQEIKAYSLCTLMPNLDTVKLALKYATKSRKTALANRLTRFLETSIQNNSFGKNDHVQNYFQNPTKNFETSNNPINNNINNNLGIQNYNLNNENKGINACSDTNNLSNFPVSTEHRGKYRDIAHKPFKRNEESESPLQTTNLHQLKSEKIKTSYSHINSGDEDDIMLEEGILNGNPNVNNHIQPVAKSHQFKNFSKMESTTKTPPVNPFKKAPNTLDKDQTLSSFESIQHKLMADKNFDANAGKKRKNSNSQKQRSKQNPITSNKNILNFEPLKIPDESVLNGQIPNLINNDGDDTVDDDHHNSISELETQLDSMTTQSINKAEISLISNDGGQLTFQDWFTQNESFINGEYNESTGEARHNDTLLKFSMNYYKSLKKKANIIDD